jgi:hypothetical protein
MKYLHRKLYSKETEKKWHLAYLRYEKEFRRIKHKFPQNFVSEILEGQAFHDSAITNLSIQRDKTQYALKMELRDGYNSAIHHQIELSDIDKLSIQMVFDSWLYAEILKVGHKRYSLEIQFPNDERLYVEFGDLQYLKTRVSGSLLR